MRNYAHTEILTACAYMRKYAHICAILLTAVCAHNEKKFEFPFQISKNVFEFATRRQSFTAIQFMLEFTNILAEAATFPGSSGSVSGSYFIHTQKYFYRLLFLKHI